jgi:hypothetical protein
VQSNKTAACTKVHHSKQWQPKQKQIEQQQTADSALVRELSDPNS